MRKRAELGRNRPPQDARRTEPILLPLKLSRQGLCKTGIAGILSEQLILSLCDDEKTRYPYFQGPA